MSAASATAVGGASAGAGEVRLAPARVLGGACAELAARLNAPVGFLRGLVIAACVLSPRAILVYVAAVLLVPHGARRWPGWENVIGALRVGLLYGVVLATGSGGVLGSPLFDQSPGVWITQGGLLLATIVALLASPSVARSGAGDRELALSSLALIAVAGMLALGAILAPGIRWEEVAAGVVALAGAALVLGGPRARGLLVPAIVAASGVVLLSASGARLQGGIGSSEVRPVRLGTLPSSYRLAIGSLDVDLSGLPASGRPLALAVSVGIGRLHLTVPAGAAVEIDARVGRGTLADFVSRGPVVTGFSIDRRIDSAALSGGAGPPVSPSTAARLRSHPAIMLRIDAEVGIGTLQLDRGAAGSGASGAG